MIDDLGVRPYSLNHTSGINIDRRVQQRARRQRSKTYVRACALDGFCAWGKEGTAGGGQKRHQAVLLFQARPQLLRCIDHLYTCSGFRV
jgi:hypothetical protein